jgi:hypothetical protein
METAIDSAIVSRLVDAQDCVLKRHAIEKVPSAIAASVLRMLPVHDRGSVACVCRHLRMMRALPEASPDSITLYTLRHYTEGDGHQIRSLQRLRSVRVMAATSSSGGMGHVYDAGNKMPCEALVGSIANLTALDVPFEVDPVSCASRSTLVTLCVRSPLEGRHAKASALDYSLFSALERLDLTRCIDSALPASLLHLRASLPWTHLDSAHVWTCPLLSSLSCMEQSLSDTEQAHLSRSLPHLRHLECQLRSPILRADATGSCLFPLLETLTTIVGPGEMDEHITKSLQHLGSLRSLRIHLYYVPTIEPFLMAMAECNQVRHLRVTLVGDNTATHVSLNAFHTCPVALQSFELDGNFAGIQNPGRLASLPLYAVHCDGRRNYDT